jgi:ribosomal protein S7
MKVRKFGKKEYRIPIRISPLKQYKKSVKWVVRSFLQRSETTLSDKLFAEFVDLLENRSKVFVWRQNLIDDIKKNRHNVSYKW